MLDTLRLDFKQALRRLCRNPGFTATAILSLALGTGANTAIFRVIDAVRLRSLPIPHPEELVEIKIAGGTHGFGMAAGPQASATMPLWQEISRSQRALSGIFAWSVNDVRFGEGSGAQLVHGLWVSPQAFHVLQVGAIRGRVFEGDDNQCDTSSAIISHRFWSGHFNSRDSAIGSRILVDDHPYSIIGIAPPEFFGLEPGKSFDIAIPLCSRTANDAGYLRRDFWWLTVMGRLAPGASLQAADEQLRAISRGVFETAAPTGYDAPSMDTWRRFRLTAVSAAGGISQLREQYGTALWLLLAIAAMVLLIACSNLANLLFAQSKSREAEVAVRFALGMGRASLAAQLLSETLLLAGLGTLAGCWIGASLSAFLVNLLSTSHDAIQLDLGSDWRTNLFTAALAVCICGFLSLASFVRLSSNDQASSIRSSGRGGATQGRNSRLQGALIASQIALSLFLLVTSLSFVRSFRSLATVDTGFRPAGLISCFLDFSPLGLPPSRVRAFQTELLDTVRRTSGVESASASTHIPLSANSWTLAIQVPGRPSAGSARVNWVSGSYFRTLGVAILQGRTFDAHDTSVARSALVVNETFARQFDRPDRILGTTVRTVAEPGYPAADYQIVGLVRDVKYDGLRESVPPIAYAPEAQNPDMRPWSSLLIRVSAPGAPSVVAALRQALAAKSPAIRLRFESVQTIAEESMTRERMLAWLAGLFAVVATALTGVGLFGVIAYIVSLRRSEIAVRMALGATPAQIMVMITQRTALVAAVGGAIGVLFSLAGARFARSLLYSLDPNDPRTLGTAVVTLLLVSIMASMFPAVKAMCIKPAAALRAE